MTNPTVFVVNDDAETCTGLRRLVESVDLRMDEFESADSFLREFDPDTPGCIVMDVRMPHMGGLDLQQMLIRRGHLIPIIFLTAYADVAVVVQSMKAGAFDFFEQPYQPQALLDRVQQAVAHDRNIRSRQASLRDINARLETLTAREQQVAALVVEGLTSKQIAGRLHLSPKTIHTHRAEAMAKLRAKSIAELTRMIVISHLASSRPGGPSANPPILGDTEGPRSGAAVEWYEREGRPPGNAGLLAATRRRDADRSGRSTEERRRR